MNKNKNLIILALVGVVVSLFWLLVIEHSKSGDRTGQAVANGSHQSNDVIKWKMVTTWPKGFPGLGTAPKHFAEVVNTMSNGRLQITVYGAGELVPALGVFDAVSLGSADAGHGAAYYWKGKIPASIFFTAVPFGLTAQENNGWLHYGGGLELWRELYEPHNVIPLAGGNTGVQMAGWFTKEINSAEDLKGLKMRIPGAAGEVFKRAGGTAVTLPGGELYTSLQTGVIDATEWVGPYNDMALGLHEAAKYYYYPGWHEPGATLELTVNKDSFEALPKDLQKIVEIAARYANQDMLDEYTARNNAAMETLVNEHSVQFRKLPDDVLKVLRDSSEAYLKEQAAADPMFAKVYANWSKFRKDVSAYHKISEQAYINTRDLK